MALLARNNDQGFFAESGGFPRRREWGIRALT